jgi:DNA adenine methylase Dam
MEFKKEELVKSPLNYTGGKYKLLPQILPYIPNDIVTFIDLFCGGCNVGVNIKANNIVCNDIEKVVIDLMNDWKKLDSEQALNILKNTIDTYQLSKTNEEGFKKIREDYNKGNKTWNMFYAMVTNAFNYQIRFSKVGNYNMPFGRDRSSFNPSLEKTFIKYIDRINKLNIQFINKDFKELNLEILNNSDLIYCDPPYLVTCASYNEQDVWNETHERELLELLDKANDMGIRFALSNVLENKGKSNDILKEWCQKYNTYHLNHTYGNCNYHAKDKSTGSTDEVLVTNYIIQ